MSSRATRASASVVNRSSGRSTSRGMPRRRTATPASSTRRADAGGEVVGLLVQQPGDLGADDAAAQQGHLHGLVVGSAHSSRTILAPGSGRRVSPVSAARLGRACGPDSRWRSAEVGGQQVVQRLPAYDDPGLAVLDRDHRRPAGRGCSCWPSSGSRRRCPGTATRSPGATSPGRNSSLTTMSPASQCLPTSRVISGRGVGGAVGEGARVVGVVQRGADVVAHPAVDGDIGAHRAAVELDGLDRADLVDACTPPARRSRGRARSRAAGPRGRGRRHSSRTILVISVASCAASDGSSWVV